MSLAPSYLALIALDQQRGAYAERSDALADAVASIYSLMALFAGPDAELSAIWDVLARRQRDVAARLGDLDRAEADMELAASASGAP